MNLFNRPLRYINVDDIHWSGNKLLSLGKTYNMAISGRIPGKSTFFNKMLYRQWYEKGRRFIYLKRLITDMTEESIKDVAANINKFLAPEDQIKFVFNKGNLKSGVCDVYCYPKSEDILAMKADDEHFMFRVIALSVPLDRVKGMIIPNLEWMFFDEFMVSKKLGGKYLPFEGEKFGQFYRTFYRESKNLRCIFCGNPYSKYSPYTAWLKMNLKDIKIGNVYSGETWAIEYIKISPELKQWVLDHDAMMDVESEELAMFSLEGRSIEDETVQVEPKQPNSCTLSYVFKLDGKFLGIFRNDDMKKLDDYRYWITVLDDGYNSGRRKVVCFNIYDLIGNSYIASRIDLKKFDGLMKCYRFYQVLFQDLEAASIFEEIYEIIGG